MMCTRLRFSTTGCLTALIVGIFACCARAADVSLYEQDPFDEITLDEENSGAVLKVLPLAIPNRKVPKKHDPKDELELTLTERPDQVYKVEWQHIVKISLFEQMVLAEAEEHFKKGRFDEAYPYYQFLEAKYPQTAGLAKAIEDYLWAQAEHEIKRKSPERALALLVELHRRNAERK
jgi:hypothetical protein